MIPPKGFGPRADKVSGKGMKRETHGKRGFFIFDDHFEVKTQIAIVPKTQQ